MAASSFPRFFCRDQGPSAGVVQALSRPPDVAGSAPGRHSAAHPIEGGRSVLESLQSGFGLLVLTGFAWLLSENRRAARWKVAAVGVALQVAVALIVLKLPPVRELFALLNRAAAALQAATEAGTSFVFGYLGGGPLPFETTAAGSSFVLAFRALPLVLVVAALTALLTYWRILPWIVRGFSMVLERSMAVGGAVGLGTAANIFVGMLEAPLFVRPYLKQLTRSELFVLMTAGMATIAGTVFFLYASFLQGVVPDAAGHLLVASLISAPAAVTIARLMVPETGMPTAGRFIPTPEARSAMDAITLGTRAGLELLLNVAAMLIVLVALVHLVNGMLGLLPDIAGAPVTLERLLGYVMMPVAWLIGVPWAEAGTAGSLLGVKVVLNELIAYLQMAQLPPEALGERSRLILTYALCGFANFGSLGIMIGGLASLVPERREEVVALGMRSIVAGMLATCSTGAVVGMLWW